MTITAHEERLPVVLGMEDVLLTMLYLSVAYFRGAVSWEELVMTRRAMCVSVKWKRMRR